MKVALVGDRPPPHGGIAVHVETLAAALAQRGHAVSVLDTAREKNYASFVAQLARLAANVELLHVHTSGHNPKSWMLAAAGGLARGLSHGNVITLHSGLLPGYLEGQPLRQRLARQALAPYAKIVAVSAPVADALVAAGVERARVAVLPAFDSDCVKPGELPAAVRELRARHAVLLSAAVSDSPIYGARVLLAAMAQLRRSVPEAGLMVFGPGARAHAGEGVHALGELDHGAALATLAASDVFVRPTLIDGDAISVREALALGVRTVASDVCARPAGTRLFRSGDPFALTDAIVAALHAPAPRPERVSTVESLISIYREVQGVQRAA